MTFNNKGRIRPAAGPEGHTHSIYQLNDVAAAGVDYQTLISSNGVWVAQTATPYAMAAGTLVYTDAVTSLAVGSSLLLGYVAFDGTQPVNATVQPDFAGGNPFTKTPIVSANLASLGAGTASLILKVSSVTLNGFNAYIVNTGTSAASVAANGVVVHWQATQMTQTTGYGVYSSDPNKI